MFWQPEFKLPSQEPDMTAVRDELREIARQLRAMSAQPAPPRPVDILGDQIRSQLARLHERRAA